MNPFSLFARKDSFLHLPGLVGFFFGIVAFVAGAIIFRGPQVEKLDVVFDHLWEYRGIIALGWTVWWIGVLVWANKVDGKLGDMSNGRNSK